MAASTGTFFTINNASFVAFLVRIAFMLYGEWQDKTMVVKYTDIDYHVFTDAARYIHEGESPYLRATYRYTPLLAMALTPNISLHPAFGKLIFILFDILAGYLIYMIQIQRGFKSQTAVFSSCCWLFNPMPITISTRGNAESIMAVLVLATLYFALKRNVVLTGIFLALAVHFKIFPIIYSLPLFFLVGESKDQNARTGSCDTPSSLLGLVKWTFKFVLHPARVKLVLVCVAMLSGITVLLYARYGFPFLWNTYLYHVTRTDVKHNFSVHFYMLYLTQGSQWSTVIGLLAFIPQLVLTAGFAFKYYRDICFCCFLQTFAFVTFNKVCTSQYFLWYLCLLPLIVPHVSITAKRAAVMVLSWFAAQALWLLPAYYLEFKGYNTFVYIWMASMVLFAVNIWILCEFLMKYTPLVPAPSKKAS